MDTIIKLREQIDTLDTQLLQLIQQRIILMKAIGEAKKHIEKPIRDTEREDQKKSLLQDQARILGVPVDLILKIWNIFFQMSHEIER